jgi:hypothetical protein
MVEIIKTVSLQVFAQHDIAHITSVVGLPNLSTGKRVSCNFTVSTMAGRGFHAPNQLVDDPFLVLSAAQF